MFNLVGSITIMMVEKKKDLRVIEILGGQKKDFNKIFFFLGVFTTVFGFLSNMPTATQRTHIIPALPSNLPGVLHSSMKSLSPSTAVYSNSIVQRWPLCEIKISSPATDIRSSSSPFGCLILTWRRAEAQCKCDPRSALGESLGLLGCRASCRALKTFTLGPSEW